MGININLLYFLFLCFPPEPSSYFCSTPFPLVKIRGTRETEVFSGIRKAMEQKPSPERAVVKNLHMVGLLPGMFSGGIASCFVSPSLLSRHSVEISTLSKRQHISKWSIFKPAMWSTTGRRLYLVISPYFSHICLWVKSPGGILTMDPKFRCRRGLVLRRWGGDDW